MDSVAVGPHSRIISLSYHFQLYKSLHRQFNLNTLINWHDSDCFIPINVVLEGQLRKFSEIRRCVLLLFKDVVICCGTFMKYQCSLYFTELFALSLRPQRFVYIPLTFFNAILGAFETDS